MLGLKRITVGIVLISAMCLAGCDTLSQRLSDLGYTEITPPSRLLRPGSIVLVRDEKPLQVGVICQPQTAFSSDFDKDLIESDSSSSRTARRASGRFKLKGSYLDRIKGEVDAKELKDIELTLSNVRVIEVPDAAVFRHISERDRFCGQAIAFRFANEEPVTLVKSVIEADVVYIVKFSREISAEAKADITEEVAIELGLGDSVVNESRIEAKNLYWGIIDDAQLASVGLERAAIEGAPTLDPSPSFAPSVEGEAERVVASEVPPVNVVDPEPEHTRLLPPGTAASVVEIE